jgi:hypothetical protein
MCTKVWTEKNETTWEIFVQMDFINIILGVFGLGLFLSGCNVFLGMCEQSSEPLGTLMTRYFEYFHRDHKFFRKVPAL